MKARDMHVNAMSANPNPQGSEQSMGAVISNQLIDDLWDERFTNFPNANPIGAHL